MATHLYLRTQETEQEDCEIQAILEYNVRPDCFFFSFCFKKKIETIYYIIYQYNMSIDTISSSL